MYGFLVCGYLCSISHRTVIFISSKQFLCFTAYFHYFLFYYYVIPLSDRENIPDDVSIGAKYHYDFRKTVYIKILNVHNPLPLLKDYVHVNNYTVIPTQIIYKSSSSIHA